MIIESLFLFLIKNRIVFPPITTNWSDEKGYVTEKNIEFYKNLAEGGVGMIIIEGTGVSQEGRSATNSLCILDESYISGFKRITNIARQNNCFCSLQLSHTGGQANPEFTKQPTISPSGITYKTSNMDFNSKAMTLNQIEEIKNKFINSAVLAKKSPRVACRAVSA